MKVLLCPYCGKSLAENGIYIGRSPSCGIGYCDIPVVKCLYCKSLIHAQGCVVKDLSEEC